ncbi:hypothetical protein SUGI_0812910 [Cryptomeria japonica]|nr:hypothetical protein SUGI_0812910 [Cryptomeria japonica]
MKEKLSSSGIVVGETTENGNPPAFDNSVGQTEDRIEKMGHQDTSEEGYPFLVVILNMIVTPDSKKAPTPTKRCFGPELEEGEIPKEKVDQEGPNVEVTSMEKIGLITSTLPAIMNLLHNPNGSCGRNIWSTCTGASSTSRLGLDMTSSSCATRSSGDITTISFGSCSTQSSLADKDKGEWKEPKRKTRGNKKMDVGNDSKPGRTSERTLRTKAKQGSVQIERFAGRLFNTSNKTVGRMDKKCDKCQKSCNKSVIITDGKKKNCKCNATAMPTIMSLTMRTS